MRSRAPSTNLRGSVCRRAVRAVADPGTGSLGVDAAGGRRVTRVTGASRTAEAEGQGRKVPRAMTTISSSPTIELTIALRLRYFS